MRHPELSDSCYCFWMSCAYNDDFEDTTVVASIISGLSYCFHEDEQELVEHHLACFSICALPLDPEWREEQLKDTQLFVLIKWLEEQSLPDDKVMGGSTSGQKCYL